MMVWVFDNTDSLVAAANFTAATFLVVLAVVTLYVIQTHQFKEGSATKWIMLGVVVECIGWAIHRTYWGMWRAYRNWGYIEWDKWFIDHGYLALIPSTIVLIGIAMITIPLWTLLRGGKVTKLTDMYIPLGLMLGVYWFFWWQIVLEPSCLIRVQDHPIAGTTCVVKNAKDLGDWSETTPPLPDIKPSIYNRN